MAKDNRIILQGVRVVGVVYTDGMEDELGAVLDQKQIERLSKKGQISGSFKSTKPVEKEGEIEKSPEKDVKKAPEK